MDDPEPGQDRSPRVRLACRWVVGLGVLFRVVEYLADRGYWLDETTLSLSLRAMATAGFLAPLTGTQIAPPGFLAAERFASLTLGDRSYALRLFPLACGVASLPMFDALASRVLRPAAALIALGMFAVSDDLIYFSAELKQYESDAAVALACTWMALVMASRPPMARRALGFAAAGAAAVWFSHPAVFVLAGVGTALLGSALARREWRTAALLIPTGLAWVASFAAVHAVSRVHLGPPGAMYLFWNFAFPPRAFSDPGGAVWWARRFLYLFVNPLDFWTPLGSTVSAVPALAFFAVGCVSLWARDRRALGIVAAPGLFTALAACLHLYPFHGRLVLFLVPSLLLLIAEGAGRVGGASRGFPVPLRRAAWGVILVPLLLFPTLRAVYHLETRRPLRDFNTHGDRRPESLAPERFPF